MAEIFKEIWLKTLPIWKQMEPSSIWSSKASKQIQPKEIFTKIYCNQTVKNQTQIILKAVREKKAHHIHWNPNKAISRCLNRNLAKQEGVSNTIYNSIKKNKILRDKF